MLSSISDIYSLDTSDTHPNCENQSASRHCEISLGGTKSFHLLRSIGFFSVLRPKMCFQLRGIGWMASPTQWAWVWVGFRSWWWTGRPGVLQFMGLQRVGHDWEIELNWTLHKIKHYVSQLYWDTKTTLSKFKEYSWWFSWCICCEMIVTVRH